MPSSLKDLVRSRANDPSVTALFIESELQPITGRGGLISAPTYARPEGDSSKLPYYAHTAEAFMPVMNDAGWYSEIRRTDDGTPVLSPRVLIDNAGSQSGRAETCLWEQRDRLGIVLPAIIVGDDRDETSLRPETKDLSPAQAAAFTEAVSVAVSTWEFAHRQQDAWVRFAESAVDPKNQVWQEDGPDSLKTTIASASAQSPELLPADVAGPILRSVAERADLVFGGVEELELLYAGAPESVAVASLLDAGVDEVVVKRGAEGASVRRGDASVDAPGFVVDAVDTVGAGDSFVAGYLSGLLGGLDPTARLLRANSCGALACTTPGDWEAGPTLAEIERFAAGGQDPVTR